MDQFDRVRGLRGVRARRVRHQNRSDGGRLLANAGTFVGALCFLAAALLVLPRDWYAGDGSGDS
jgi:hypothetical protein